MANVCSVYLFQFFSLKSPFPFPAILASLFLSHQHSWPFPPLPSLFKDFPFSIIHLLAFSTAVTGFCQDYTSPPLQDVTAHSFHQDYRVAEITVNRSLDLPPQTELCLKAIFDRLCSVSNKEKKKNQITLWSHFTPINMAYLVPLEGGSSPHVSMKFHSSPFVI